MASELVRPVDRLLSAALAALASSIGGCAACDAPLVCIDEAHGAPAAAGSDTLKIGEKERKDQSSEPNAGHRYSFLYGHLCFLACSHER
jgi:hypothetical protein